MNNPILHLYWLIIQYYSSNYSSNRIVAALFFRFTDSNKYFFEFIINLIWWFYIRKCMASYNQWSVYCHDFTDLVTITIHKCMQYSAADISQNKSTQNKHIFHFRITPTCSIVFLSHSNLFSLFNWYLSIEFTRFTTHQLLSIFLNQ
jgi:hypothetical protein